MEVIWATNERPKRSRIVAKRTIEPSSPSSSESFPAFFNRLDGFCDASGREDTSKTGVRRWGRNWRRESFAPLRPP